MDEWNDRSTGRDGRPRGGSNGGAGTSPATGPDESCATCGSPVSMETWTPTAVEQTAEGSVVHYFCEEGCLTDWRARE